MTDTNRLTDAELERFDAGLFNWQEIPLADRLSAMARELLAYRRAGGAQRDPNCPECNGTGERDSGGTYPWGAPAMLPCECAPPPASRAAVAAARVDGWNAAMAKVADWHARKAAEDKAEANAYRQKGDDDGSVEACLSDALCHLDSAAFVRALALPAPTADASK